MCDISDPANVPHVHHHQPLLTHIHLSLSHDKLSLLNFMPHNRPEQSMWFPSLIVRCNNSNHSWHSYSVDLKARGGTLPATGQPAYRNTMLTPPPLSPTPPPPPAGEQEVGGGAVKTAVLQLRGDTNPVLWEYCAHLPPSSIAINKLILAWWEFVAMTFDKQHQRV